MNARDVYDSIYIIHDDEYKLNFIAMNPRDIYAISFVLQGLLVLLSYVKIGRAHV